MDKKDKIKFAIALIIVFILTILMDIYFQPFG